MLKISVALLFLIVLTQKMRTIGKSCDCSCNCSPPIEVETEYCEGMDDCKQRSKKRPTPTPAPPKPPSPTTTTPTTTTTTPTTTTTTPTTTTTTPTTTTTTPTTTTTTPTTTTTTPTTTTTTPTTTTTTPTTTTTTPTTTTTTPTTTTTTPTTTTTTPTTTTTTPTTTTTTPTTTTTTPTTTTTRIVPCVRGFASCRGNIPNQCVHGKLLSEFPHPRGITDMIEYCNNLAPGAGLLFISSEAIGDCARWYAPAMFSQIFGTYNPHTKAWSYGGEPNATALPDVGRAYPPGAGVEDYGKLALFVSVGPWSFTKSGPRGLNEPHGVLCGYKSDE